MEKTALITGAAKRIGKSVACHLAERGWNIIVHYNNSPVQVNELVDSLRSRFIGQEFEIVRADLSIAAEVENLISGVVSAYGRFELLINNASVFKPAFLAETSHELLINHLNVNMVAPFILIRDFARLCRNGVVINLVDTRITNNRSNFAAYSLSKKGLWELTKMAALEFAPDIRINAVAPGVTIPPEDKNEDYLNKLAGDIPMKKSGGIEPVLKSIDYILENNHLTGQLLFADGGENLKSNS